MKKVMNLTMTLATNYRFSQLLEIDKLWTILTIPPQRIYTTNYQIADKGYQGINKIHQMRETPIKNIIF